METEKWAAVLEGMGHSCFYFAGSSDRPAGRSRTVPEALFMHPDVRAIYEIALMERARPLNITRLVTKLKDYLKEQLVAFVRDYDIELLVAENSLTIPMNIPLGLALTEYIAESGKGVIAHHHDFYWERQRYLVNCVQDYLDMAFPPKLPSIHHVVINSLAARQLGLRTGVSALLIPNVMDFDHPPSLPDDYTRQLRQDLGVTPDEYLFLQPTRVVQRKGIEHAIELSRRVGANAHLVISHASGDERDDYERRVREYAQLMEVPVSFVADLIRPQRGWTPDGRKVYSLSDVFVQADLVTYPSTIEGFGNAFLEAIYFRRPIVVNDYSIFDVDIKPKGFKVIEFAGYITEDTVSQARRVLEDPELSAQIVDHNYKLGKRHYSFSVLERLLQTLLGNIFGENNAG